MSENLFAVLGLSPGPVSDAQLAAAYERRLARCRRRIRDENVLAARCRQSRGGQGVDVGLIISGPPRGGGL